MSERLERVLHTLDGAGFGQSSSEWATANLRRCWRCHDPDVDEDSPSGLCTPCAAWLRGEISDAQDESRRKATPFRVEPALSLEEWAAFAEAVRGLVAEIVRVLTPVFDKILELAETIGRRPNPPAPVIRLPRRPPREIPHRAPLQVPNRPPLQFRRRT